MMCIKVEFFCGKKWIICKHLFRQRTRPLELSLSELKRNNLLLACRFLDVLRYSMAQYALCIFSYKIFVSTIIENCYL